MDAYQVTISHADEPEQNQKETINRTTLIKMFPFIESIFSFDRLAIDAGLTTTIINKIS